ncbi:hypothetical protein QJS10_CPB22g00969 [Acorus calamus]|uniref:Uncharacterized protein n=1 Tax=Acorus calamus TaxID=4465 RepID=A0AAV9C203_ACOCL|nr:hypothetical protein QJS10_CPB22g00969 [Acorus calamus]
MAGAMTVSYIHQATQTRRRQPPSHRRSSGGLGKKCMSMVKQQKTRCETHVGIADMDE